MEAFSKLMYPLGGLFSFLEAFGKSPTNPLGNIFRTSVSNQMYMLGSSFRGDILANYHQELQS